MARLVWIAYARIADIGERALADVRNRLTPAERRRCARFGSSRRKREFLAARWLLQASCAAWHHPKRAAHDSISHSGGWVACALVRRGTVGIDIEPMVSRDFSRLGAWAFPALATEPWSEETADLATAFYGRWTRYEARLKAQRAAPQMTLTWFIDGVALSVHLPLCASLQAGMPRRWRPRAGFVKRLRG